MFLPSLITSAHKEVLFCTFPKCLVLLSVITWKPMMLGRAWWLIGKMRRPQCPGVLTSGHSDNHHQTINLYSWKELSRSCRVGEPSTEAYRGQRGNTNKWRRPVSWSYIFFLKHMVLSGYISFLYCWQCPK